MTAMKRDITVTTNLGADILLCGGMNGTEEMSRPFEYVVDLLTQEEDIELHKLIGQPMTVNLTIAEGKTRYFNGLVSKVGYTGSEGDYHTYRAIVRPWLWTLSRRTDCRVFQDMTVPDIVKEVFRDAGFSDFEEKLSGDYVERGYCVQYRESDLGFVSRLLEEDGIYFYFIHEDGKHTLVLADSINAHAPFDGHADMKFFPPGRTETLEEPHIFDWDVSHEYQSNIFAQTDYDFIEPTKDLATNASIPREHTRAEFEVYDYPGGYDNADDGDTLSKIRIEEIQAGYERCAGSGNIPGVAVGHLFTLGNHPRGDQNREYLVLTCNHVLTVSGYESKGSAGGQASYECGFTVQPSAQAYRPPRITPKPGVRGPQTATIVGPDGETVWCDEYGRVKVQFHWDRVGELNENSSCWVRVSQPSAGAHWGSMFLPHIGQEVIVDFLEGDPDKPIITGRVYNADNMPPMTLPDNKHKSIIRDHYGNEIVMDGTPGQEHLGLYSPTHESVLVIGRSVFTATSSNDITYTAGWKYNEHLGNLTQKTRGNMFTMVNGFQFILNMGTFGQVDLGVNFGVVVGMKYGLLVGGEVDICLAWKFSAGFSREWAWTKGNSVTTSDSSIILDSQQDVLIAGGKKDNSYMRSNDNELVLSFDKTATPRNLSKGHTKAKILAGVGATLITGAAVVKAAREGDSFAGQGRALDSTGRENGQWPSDTFQGETVSMDAEDWVYTGALVTGAVLSIAAGAVGVKDETPGAHSAPSAKVTLSENLVEIEAGSGLTSSIKMGANSPEGIIVDAKEQLDLLGANLVLVETKKLQIDADSVVYNKGTIEHPNFKVLK